MNSTPFSDFTDRLLDAVALRVAKTLWDDYERNYWDSERDFRPFDPSVTERDSDNCDRGRDLFETVKGTLTMATPLLREAWNPPVPECPGCGQNLECPDHGPTGKQQQAVWNAHHSALVEQCDRLRNEIAAQQDAWTKDQLALIVERDRLDDALERVAEKRANRRLLHPSHSPQFKSPRSNK